MTKVIISNATRLHAHRHAYALQQAGLLKLFVTSLWHKQKSFPYILRPYLPKFIGGKISSFLSKREHSHLEDRNVVQIWNSEIIRLFLDVLTFGKLRARLHLWQKIRYDKSVAKLVQKNQPDIFVGFELSCAESMKMAKMVGAVTILDLAGLEHDFALKNLDTETNQTSDIQKISKQRKMSELELADHIICVSGLSQQALVNSGVNVEKIKTIYLGLNHDVFSTQNRNWKKNEASFRIIYAGNISRNKGVCDLVDAFNAARIENSELYLIGSIVDVPLERLSGDNITLLPFMSAKELAHNFAQADIFVLPSYVDSWGQVLPEAMACGLPVIATRMCGASELITKKNGRIFNPGDVKELTNILEELSRDKRSLCEMGRQAAEDVSHLSWDTYNDNITKFYKKLLRA